MIGARAVDQIHERCGERRLAARPRAGHEHEALGVADERLNVLRQAQVIGRCRTRDDQPERCARAPVVAEAVAPETSHFGEIQNPLGAVAAPQRITLGLRGEIDQQRLHDGGRECRLAFERDDLTIHAHEGPGTRIQVKCAGSPCGGQPQQSVRPGRRRQLDRARLGFGSNRAASKRHDHGLAGFGGRRRDRLGRGLRSRLLLDRRRCARQVGLVLRPGTVPPDLDPDVIAAAGHHGGEPFVVSERRRRQVVFDRAQFVQNPPAVRRQQLREHPLHRVGRDRARRQMDGSRCGHDVRRFPYVHDQRITVRPDDGGQQGVDQTGGSPRTTAPDSADGRGPTLPFSAERPIGFNQPRCCRSRSAAVTAAGWSAKTSPPRSSE